MAPKVSLWKNDFNDPISSALLDPKSNFDPFIPHTPAAKNVSANPNIMSQSNRVKHHVTEIQLDLCKVRYSLTCLQADATTICL